MNSDLYRNKYLKYKSKYLKLKQGGAFPENIGNLKVLLNYQHNISVLFTIPLSKEDLNLKLLSILKNRGHPQFLPVLEKYLKDDNKFVKINNKFVTLETFDNPLENFINNKLIVLTLINEEESDIIKDFKIQLDNISKPSEKNLIYISTMSFLNTDDSLENIIYQQFLPIELIKKGLIPQFNKIYIFLIDGGFSTSESLRKNNVITKKDEVFKYLGLVHFKSKFNFFIIPSNIPNIDKFYLNLSQYVRNNTEIYVSTAGNNIQEILKY